MDCVFAGAGGPRNARTSSSVNGGRLVVVFGPDLAPSFSSITRVPLQWGHATGLPDALAGSRNVDEHCQHFIEHDMEMSSKSEDKSG
ncbi:MAG TPA: hypothetical protein VFI31_00025 [Pirellulales bacterium]|nr:hypothetical protein [Pirellulales bacterium]